MAIEGLSINNYALLPSLITTGRIDETYPAVTTAEQQATLGTTSSFSDMLETAMAGTVASDAAAKTDALGLLLGADTDLHTIAISAEKAELMLNLTIQMRNKMVESYQEIMRMQI